MQDLVNQMIGTVNQMQGIIQTCSMMKQGMCGPHLQVQNQVEELTRRLEVFESQMKGKKK
jgi:hypothetical protein